MEAAVWLEQARRIILAGLRGQTARVYLFGSRARGEGAELADLDVGILPLQPLPIGLLSAIREELEESHIPFTVDLVDLSAAGDAFRQAVEREGTLWHG